MISIDLQVLSSRSEISIDWPHVYHDGPTPKVETTRLSALSNHHWVKLNIAAFDACSNVITFEVRKIFKATFNDYIFIFYGGWGGEGGWFSQSKQMNWKYLNQSEKYPLSQWKICLSKCVLIIVFKTISNKHSKSPSLTFNNINIHTLKCSPGPSRLYFQHLHLFNDCLTREQRKSGRVSVDFLMLLYLLKLSIGWID